VTASRPVVVGVGRPAPNRLALAWAADEATRHRVPLRLVHALEWPRGAVSEPETDNPDHNWSAHYRASGEWVLRDALDAVRERRPGLEVETLLVDGTRARVLCEQSKEASLVAIGSRRSASLEELFIGGGLAVALSSHAACPVAVIRAPEHITHTPQLVVVGVDGSENSKEAVALAFEEAVLRSARLLAVQVRRPLGRPVAAARDRWLEAEARAELSEATAGWQEKYPDIEVRHEVLHGKSAHRLIREAAHADCLVVGARGGGGFRGLMLGSVSHDLLHHTPCPLIVVPHRDDQ
jgi:nucleotide-binding universal stress UspA family protein